MSTQLLQFYLKSKTNNISKGYIIFHSILSSIVAVEAFQIWRMMVFYQETWLEAFARSEINRPFVFRILLPALTRIFEFLFPGDALFWLFVLFVSSAVCFYFASKYLADFFGAGQIIPFIACQVMFVVSIAWIKPYDYATGALFALCLGLLARGKHRVFLIVFAIATVNRETTFLLILFYVFYFWGKMSMQKMSFFVLTQIAVYVSIKLIIQNMFEGSGGEVIFFNAHLVLSSYAKLWYIFLPMVFIVVITKSRYRKMPEFIQKAIVFIFVPQVILHLLFGMPFEFRVFTESIPFMCILMKR